VTKYELCCHVMSFWTVSFLRVADIWHTEGCKEKATALCMQERRETGFLRRSAVSLSSPHPGPYPFTEVQENVSSCCTLSHTIQPGGDLRGTSVVLLFHGRGHWGQERLSDLPEATPRFSPGGGLISQITRSASGRTFTSAKYQSCLSCLVVHSLADNMT